MAMMWASCFDLCFESLLQAALKASIILCLPSEGEEGFQIDGGIDGDAALRRLWRRRRRGGRRCRDDTPASALWPRRAFLPSSTATLKRMIAQRPISARGVLAGPWA